MPGLNLFKPLVSHEVNARVIAVYCVINLAGECYGSTGPGGGWGRGCKVAPGLSLCGGPTVVGTDGSRPKGHQV